MSEPSVLIFDLGSSHIRTGLSCHKTPDLIFPSAFPTGNHDFPIDQSLPEDFDPSFAIVDGEVDNIDRITYIFASVYDRYFDFSKAEPNDLRIVLTTTPYGTIRNSEILAQDAFELLGADKLLMKPPAVYTFTSFSMENCICVDIGYDTTHVIPVENNMICTKGVEKIYNGGSALDLFTSRYQLNIEEITSWKQMENARKLKEKNIEIVLNYEDTIKKLNENDELKEFGCTCGELLFRPSLYEAGISKEGINDERISSLMEEPGIAKLIDDSIKKCDLHNRGKLYQHILLSGGCSKIKGLKERLISELKKLGVQCDINIFMAEDPENSAWNGEALLCRCYPESEQWLTKEEYNEDYNSVYQKFNQYGINPIDD